jgi:hypothetical protein
MWRHRQPAPDVRHGDSVFSMSEVVQSLADVTVDGSVSLARAAEEGATAAQHLLGMCVRAIDYLPPVEFEFPDFLAALLVSDAEIVPDDKHGYRDTVLRQRTSLSATMDLQPGVTHVELAAPAFGDAPFTVVGSG